MPQLEIDYFNEITRRIKNRISSEISGDTIHAEIVPALQYHLENERSESFQNYYFRTVNNMNYYLNYPKFFQEFKRQYALQGITNEHLIHLENNKKHIMSFVQKNNLLQLYVQYFENVSINNNNKTLGSFFSKFVHTFKPEIYCALDNPIKNYFNLKKEGFFISFSVTSKAYREWANENRNIIRILRRTLAQIDRQNIIPNTLTDLKLLDLIFWSKANIRSKGKRQK